jgi:hypothetical protein
VQIPCWKASSFALLLPSLSFAHMSSLQMQIEITAGDGLSGMNLSYANLEPASIFLSSTLLIIIQ